MTDFSCRLVARKRGILLIVAAFVACAAITSGRSYAATSPVANAPVFASVDMSKIISSYSKRQDADNVFKALEEQYQDVYKTQSANAMLDEADQTKLGQLLLLGDSATADQKQQVQDLETAAGKSSSDLAALQQKKNPTEADVVQLTQLSKQQQDGQQALQDIADSYKGQLDTKNQSMSADIASDIRAAVADVAKKQNVSVVFDSSVAIYASLDLTPAVITKLGGTK